MLTEQRIAGLRGLQAGKDAPIDWPVYLQRVLTEVLDAYGELQAELTDAKKDATVATAVANNKFVTHCGDCGSELTHLATIADKSGWLNIAVETCEFCNEANLAKLQAVVDKLQKLADGEPAYEGRVVFSIEQDGSIYERELVWWGTGRAELVMHGGFRFPSGIWCDCWHKPEDCYSTEAAAKAGGEA